MTQPAGWEEFGLPIKLNVQEAKLTEEQFMRLCQENPELRIELTAKGELVIMPPTGSKTGLRNSTLTYELVTWAKIDSTGLVFASSTHPCKGSLVTLA